MLKKHFVTGFCLFFFTFASAQWKESEDGQLLFLGNKQIGGRSFSAINYEINEKFAIVSFDSMNQTYKSCFNTKGRQIIPPIYTNILTILDESRMVYYFQLFNGNKTGICNTHGEIIVPVKFNYIEIQTLENIRNETYFLAVDSSFQYLFNGKGMLNCGRGFHYLLANYCGINQIIISGDKTENGDTKYGFSNLVTGKPITKCQYDFFQLVANNTFMVKQDTLIGFVGLQGEMISPRFIQIGSIGDSASISAILPSDSMQRVFLTRENRFLDDRFDIVEEHWPYLILTKFDYGHKINNISVYHLEKHQYLNGVFTDYQIKFPTSNSKFFAKNQAKILIAQDIHWFELHGLHKKSSTIKTRKQL